MSIKGKVWKYGDDVNTDVIFPGKYTYTVSDPAEMAQHALEDIDPDFAQKVQEGDIIAAGLNFGCGSSREQAAFCLKYNNIGAIVAKSYSRLFFRNAVNAGIPLIQSGEATDVLEKGEKIEINFEKGELYCKGKTFTFPPLPESVLGIIKDGGLIPHTRKVLGIE